MTEFMEIIIFLGLIGFLSIFPLAHWIDNLKKEIDELWGDLRHAEDMRTQLIKELNKAIQLNIRLSIKLKDLKKKEE